MTNMKKFLFLSVFVLCVVTFGYAKVNHVVVSDQIASLNGLASKDTTQYTEVDIVFTTTKPIDYRFEKDMYTLAYQQGFNVGIKNIDPYVAGPVNVKGQVNFIYSWQYWYLYEDNALKSYMAFVQLLHKYKMLFTSSYSYK